MLFAQTATDSSQSILDRLNGGELFALMMTFSVLSICMFFLVVMGGMYVFRSIRVTRMRTEFVRELLDQGMNPVEIREVARVAFGSTLPLRRMRNADLAMASTSVPREKKLPRREHGMPASVAE